MIRQVSNYLYVRIQCESLLILGIVHVGYLCWASVLVLAQLEMVLITDVLLLETTRQRGEDYTKQH